MKSVDSLCDAMIAATQRGEKEGKVGDNSFSRTIEFVEALREAYHSKDVIEFGNRIVHFDRWKSDCMPREDEMLPLSRELLRKLKVELRAMKS